MLESGRTYPVRAGDDGCVCRICGSGRTRAIHGAREMMLGFGDEFIYFKCESCGCLQISEQPENLARYYPASYYSFDVEESGFKALVRDWLTLNGPSLLFGSKNWFKRGNWRSVATVPRNARILDVGCGAGSFVRQLSRLGFSDLTGLDPFIEASRVYSSNVRLIKGQLENLTGSFDVVMLHHSLEHMWDQVGAATKIRSLLSDGGQAIIRVPTVDSYAWERYYTNWANLDPPRHFYLHSRVSIRELLENSGFVVEQIIDDANEFGIVGSENARLNRSTVCKTPLPDGSWKTDVARIDVLNSSQRGDQISLVARAV